MSSTTANLRATLLSSSPFSPSCSFINNMVSVSPNGTTMLMKTQMPLSSSCALSIPRPTYYPVRPRSISCEVAFKSSDSEAAVEVNENDRSSSQSTSSQGEVDAGAKIGARVRVKMPLKVYHIPKVPELDLTGMEGQIKQYVGLWNGKRISANLPYKVQFVTEIQGRGPVKFFAHLKEDEFEYV